MCKGRLCIVMHKRPLHNCTRRGSERIVGPDADARRTEGFGKDAVSRDESTGECAIVDVTAAARGRAGLEDGLGAARHDGKAHPFDDTPFEGLRDVLAIYGDDLPLTNLTRRARRGKSAQLFGTYGQRKPLPDQFDDLFPRGVPAVEAA